MRTDVSNPPTTAPALLEVPAALSEVLRAVLGKVPALTPAQSGLLAANLIAKLGLNNGNAKTLDLAAKLAVVAYRQGLVPLNKVHPAIVEVAGQIDSQSFTADDPQEPATAASSVPVAEPEPERAPSAGGDGDDALMALLARRLNPLIEAKGKLDEAGVETIAKRVVGDLDAKIKHALGNGAFPADKVAKQIEAAMAQATHRIEFVTPAGEVKQLTGLMHPQVPQIVAWLRAGVPVWAWGAAGSGKTHMARQVAEMLGVEPRVVSVDPTLTVSKLLGYRNVSNGEFIEGFLYGAYKNGGLAALDEVDTGDPGVIASINALLSNSHYLFPNNETVARHDQFYNLALGNTRGLGATPGYVARNKLDAATLDRFAVIEIKYDDGLETALACGSANAGDPWCPTSPADHNQQHNFVRWIQKVRAFAGQSVLISPRASINGCKALRCGIPMGEVVEALVYKLCTSDTVSRIKDGCGEPL